MEQKMRALGFRRYGPPEVQKPRAAATVNPITYVLEATRAILNTGWDASLILRGLGAGGLMFAALFAFALYVLRARTRRR